MQCLRCTTCIMCVPATHASYSSHVHVCTNRLTCVRTEVAGGGGGGGAHMPTVPYAENGPEYAVKFAVST